MARTWKYVAAYAVYREWRWRRHQAINEKKRNPPPPPAFVGYGTWIFSGLFMTGLWAIPALCFWYLPIAMVGIGFVLFWTWVLVAIGCVCRYLEKHPRV